MWVCGYIHVCIQDQKFKDQDRQNSSIVIYFTSLILWNIIFKLASFQNGIFFTFTFHYLFYRCIPCYSVCDNIKKSKPWILNIVFSHPLFKHLTKCFVFLTPLDLLYMTSKNNSNSYNLEFPWAVLFYFQTNLCCSWPILENDLHSAQIKY